MLNATDALDESQVNVSPIAYQDAVVASAMGRGRMNTDEEELLANIQSACRRGHPQMRQWPVRGERICLVGSGPSLASTLDELRQAVWEGATLVTLNGAYHWCIEHGLRPNTQIVMDARPGNARFVEPAVPHCRYVLASQCAPTVWDAVEGRPEVWIWHAVVAKDDAITTWLNDYYRSQWMGVGGGTSVATRALMLLRMAGYVRFDLFGIDCCWQDGVHHAMAQPENDHEQPFAIHVGDAARPETMRVFRCSAWHLKQFEDLLTVLRVNGTHFTVNPHGDGMFAYILRTLGERLDDVAVRNPDAPASLTEETD